MAKIVNDDYEARILCSLRSGRTSARHHRRDSVDRVRADALKRKIEAQDAARRCLENAEFVVAGDVVKGLRQSFRLGGAAERYVYVVGDNAARGGAAGIQEFRANGNVRLVLRYALRGGDDFIGHLAEPRSSEFLRFAAGEGQENGGQRTQNETAQSSRSEGPGQRFLAGTGYKEIQ